jgi:hypothetical protein
MKTGLLFGVTSTCGLAAAKKLEVVEAGLWSWAAETFELCVISK